MGVAGEAICIFINLLEPARVRSFGKIMMLLLL